MGGGGQSPPPGSPTLSAWLQGRAFRAGLDAAVQGYPFEAWGLAGAELLGLSAGVLEALGVRRVGHQELLLDAVEQLRALVSPGTHGCCWGVGWVEGGGGMGVTWGDRGAPWGGWRRDLGLPWGGWRGGHGVMWGWMEGGTWGHPGMHGGFWGGTHGDTLGWMRHKGVIRG